MAQRYYFAVNWTVSHNFSLGKTGGGKRGLPIYFFSLKWRRFCCFLNEDCILILHLWEATLLIICFGRSTEHLGTIWGGSSNSKSESGDWERSCKLDMSAARFNNEVAAWRSGSYSTILDIHVLWYWDIFILKYVDNVVHNESADLWPRSPPSFKNGLDVSIFYKCRRIRKTPESKFRRRSAKFD